MISISKFAAGFGLATVAVLIALPADAGCKRMQFLVNDYGKEGPTKDSQDLLDKHIAQWAAEQGIEKYTVGKKETTCELFLNFILFDEHTCTTRATVCWGGDKLPGEQQAKASKKPAADKTADAGKVEPAKADGTAKPADDLADAVAKPAGGQTETPPADAAAATPPAETAKKSEKAEAAKSESTPPAAEDTTLTDAAAAGATMAETKATEPAPAEKAASSTVETGTIPLSNKPTGSAPAEAAAAGADPAISVTQRDAVAAATAAAERAAAAAERAAQAAERAAAALNERIAADAEKTQASATKSESAASDEKPAFTPPNAALVAPVQPTTKE